MRKPRKIRMPKPKAVKVELIPDEQDGKRQPIYALADKLIGQHHGHLRQARIAFAWHAGWSADVDGHHRLATTKRGSDLDRALHGQDFVICLNRQAVTLLKDKQLAAVIDHQLCHCEVARDRKSGEIKTDDKGRTVYRLRKHDVEEFVEVVGRHGLWKNDLVKLVEVAEESPLFEKPKAAAV